MIRSARRTRHEPMPRMNGRREPGLGRGSGASRSRIGVPPARGSVVGGMVDLLGSLAFKTLPFRVRFARRSVVAMDARLEALLTALNRRQEPRDLAAFLEGLAGPGALPSPWETWTLIGLVRHRERQLW